MVKLTLLNDLKNCFSFLTRFPITKKVNIYEDIAPKMWLFPIVGFVLGLLSSFISLILFNFLPFLLVGFIILGLLLLMTGGHHTDGLLDFGDGLMTTGLPERKIAAMHDTSIGAGGFIFGFIILSLTGIAISYSMNYIMMALVLSEIGAKFAMVAACSIGKSANTKMIKPFIRFNKKKHMVLSFVLSIFLIILTVLIINLCNFLYQTNILIKSVFYPINPIVFNEFVVYIGFIFIIGILIPLILIIKLANKNFNGLTGDCLGALNETTRLFILIIIITFNALNLI